VSGRQRRTSPRVQGEAVNERDKGSRARYQGPPRAIHRSTSNAFPEGVVEARRGIYLGDVGAEFLQNLSETNTQDCEGSFGTDVLVLSTPYVPINGPINPPLSNTPGLSIELTPLILPPT
jgi:hypothetical protein